MNGGNFIAMVMAWLVLVAGVQAHDPGLSGLLLRSSNSILQATITLAQADANAVVLLDADQDGRVTTEEFTKARPDLERAALEALRVSLDEVPLASNGAAARMDSSGEVQLVLSFPLKRGSRLRVHSLWLASLPRGHRQYVLLRGSDGRPLGDKLLDARQPEFVVVL